MKMNNMSSELSKTILESLIRNLATARNTKNQEQINKAAHDLADYLWKPEYNIPFEELLEGFGFIKEEKIYAISK